MLSAVLRIATHPAIFKPPSPRDATEAFIDTCLAAPAAKAVRAEAAHWALFRNLCTKADCRGNLIQGAYLAAMALEHDCTYVTTDGDYARLLGLRRRHPIRVLMGSYHVTGPFIVDVCGGADGRRSPSDWNVPVRIGTANSLLPVSVSNAAVFN